jgi:hypothetical protein
MFSQLFRNRQNRKRCCLPIVALLNGMFLVHGIDSAFAQESFYKDTSFGWLSDFPSAPVSTSIAALQPSMSKHIPEVPTLLSRSRGTLTCPITTM